jgi:hypothetical protein
MHRSGTSVVTGMLNLLGMEIGQEILPSGEDNPLGFFENSHIVSIQIGLMHAVGTYFGDILPLPEGWEYQPQTRWYRDRLLELLEKEFGDKPLWGFKDPRTCILLPMWNRLFDAMRVEAGFVLMVRHPDEVAESMKRRDKTDYNHAAIQWVLHMLEAERHTRGRLRAIVGFDQVLRDWQGTIKKIGSSLEIQWPNDPQSVLDQLGQFVNPKLRHETTHIKTADEAVRQRGWHTVVAKWAMTIHQALSAAAADPLSRVDTAVMDQVQADFTRALPQLKTIRPGPPKGQRFETEYKGVEQMVYRPVKTG